MLCFHLSSKTQSSYRLVNILLISSFLCLLYLLVSLFLLETPLHFHTNSSSQEDAFSPTSVGHIVFGIASSEKTWPKRKNQVKLWWKPHEMNGCVFLDSLPHNDEKSYTSESYNASLPRVCISEDTSQFRYTFQWGYRSAIRIARVVRETIALYNHSKVRWYVFGDDDTVYFPENLVKTLSKYDHELWHYVGSNSEDYHQNRDFGFEMAFGGAGFAISYPLAQVLAKVFDSCIARYAHLYGSDSRIYSCMTELGVKLKIEPGFHQFDIRGNIFGLLTAHPLTPVVSFHHMEYIDPIFPNKTVMESLEHLFEAVKFDSQRIMQQTVCYDRWFSWTISVSWGYAVQIFENHVLLPDVLGVQETFNKWKGSFDHSKIFTFNTRQLHPDPCHRPTVFYMDKVHPGQKDEIKSYYKKSYVNCSYDKNSPRSLKGVRVFTQKLDLDIKQAPRRQCCDVLGSSIAGEGIDIAIRECKEDELIYMHP